MCWFTNQLVASRVKLETSICGGQEKREERGRPLQIGDSFKKQGNLYSLGWPQDEQIDLPTHPPHPPDDCPILSLPQ